MFSAWRKALSLFNFDSILARAQPERSVDSRGLTDLPGFLHLYETQGNGRTAVEEGSVIYPEVAIPGEIALGWRPFPDLDSVFFPGRKIEYRQVDKGDLAADYQDTPGQWT